MGRGTWYLHVYAGMLRQFLFYVTVVPLSAPYLEQQWGTKELLLFSTIITIVTNIITWILALLISTVQMAVGISSGKLSMLHSHFDGMHIILTGFLVAYAQLMQDQSVFWVYSYRIRDLLMLLIGLTNIPILLGFVAPFFQVQVAWIVAWVYLRFYQYGAAGQRGDASESFAFVEYFPSFIRPFLSPAMHTIHRIVSAWDLLPSAARYTDLELSIANVPLVDARTEAERRRTMALSALDSRSSSDKAQMQTDSDLASRRPAKGVVPGTDRDAGHKLWLGSDNEAAPISGFSAASTPIPRPMPSMTSTAPGPASRIAAPSVAGADLSPSSAT